MMTDPERFAFVPRRIHAFASTGNAYDACQVDDAIKTGHTLIILPEGVVGLAGTWPIAITAAGGVLHSVIGKDGDTLDSLSAHFDLTPDDIGLRSRLHEPSGSHSTQCSAACALDRFSTAIW